MGRRQRRTTSQYSHFPWWSSQAQQLIQHFECKMALQLFCKIVQIGSSKLPSVHDATLASTSISDIERFTCCCSELATKQQIYRCSELFPQWTGIKTDCGHDPTADWARRYSTSVSTKAGKVLTTTSNGLCTKTHNRGPCLEDRLKRNAFLTFMQQSILHKLCTCHLR